MKPAAAPEPGGADAWDAATTIVDLLKGYTLEFAANKESHRFLYKVAEEEIGKLLRAAEDAARRSVLEAVIKWHSREAHSLRQGAFKERPTDDVALDRARIHLKSVAHFKEEEAKR